jgi:hypothetical protein
MAPCPAQSRSRCHARCSPARENISPAIAAVATILILILFTTVPMLVLE